MSRSLTLAWVCGAVPLLSGTAIFIGWMLTDWEWLMAAGVVTLYVGLAAFIVGCISLTAYGWLATRSPSYSRWRLFTTIGACAALLFANFPAAAGILAAVIWKETAYTVVVINESPHVLAGTRLAGGGVEEFFGDIPAGGTATRSMWFTCDGRLTLFTTSNGEHREVSVDGYVTNSGGGRTTVVVDNDGAFSVQHRHR